MVRFASLDWIVVAGVVVGVAPALAAVGANEPGQPQTLAELAAEPARLLGSTADMELRFIQEDGPDAGHVRVELTPETRPLTMLEARSAAQQGFLAALDEPGLGDNLSRVIVVVRLMPASHPDPSASEQRFLFLHKGGRDWSVLSGD
jgi:hypothetical protein